MAKNKQNDDDGFGAGDDEVDDGFEGGAGGDDGFEGGDGSVTVNLNEVEAASFEVIPRGVYDTTIESCEYGLSQNSGKPMWTLQLVISAGQYENRKLFTHISFSEKALPFTKRTLSAIAPELLSGPFNPEDAASTMEGKQVRAKVTVEKYEGENRNRVRDLLAPSANNAFLG